MPEQDPLVEQIRQMIADVLSEELDDVTPTALFASDLGGESLDAIDLNFKLSRQFGVNSQLQRLGVGAELDDRGILTPASIAMLRQQHPYLDLAPWRDRRLEYALDLLTPVNVAGYIRALQAQQQPASA